MSQDPNHQSRGRRSVQDDDLLDLHSVLGHLPGAVALLEELQYLRDALDKAEDVPLGAVDANGLPIDPATEHDLHALEALR